MFKCICVDHVGIACKDLEVSKRFYTEVLGLTCTGEETVEEQKATTVFIPCGETMFELLVATAPESPIARYIEKNGQGIQHVAIRVDDIKAAIADVQEKGAIMIDKEPRRGAGGMDIAFIHPKSVGSLLEFCAPHKD